MKASKMVLIGWIIITLILAYMTAIGFKHPLFIILTLMLCGIATCTFYIFVKQLENKK